MPRPYRDAVAADPQEWLIPQRFHHIRPLRGRLLLKEKAGGRAAFAPLRRGESMRRGFVLRRGEACLALVFLAANAILPLTNSGDEQLEGGACPAPTGMLFLQIRRTGAYRSDFTTSVRCADTFSSRRRQGGALHLLPSEEGSCQPEGMTEGYPSSCLTFLLLKGLPL